MSPNLAWQLSYHEANPHIYKMFAEYALKFIANGYKNAGAKQVIEVMRWETAIRARADIFKINNNIASFYARLFMSTHPEHKGFFRLREPKLIPCL